MQQLWQRACLSMLLQKSLRCILSYVVKLSCTYLIHSSNKGRWNEQFMYHSCTKGIKILMGKQPWSRFCDDFDMSMGMCTHKEFLYPLGTSRASSRRRDISCYWHTSSRKWIYIAKTVSVLACMCGGIHDRWSEKLSSEIARSEFRNKIWPLPFSTWDHCCQDFACFSEVRGVTSWHFDKVKCAEDKRSLRNTALVSYISCCKIYTFHVIILLCPRCSF